ncbi:MAG: ABC transporter ATP-binding protein [Chloroflexi bacterium]|nr:ABC transporter ATP-binding protein [Chloroflexota bacterium]
MTNLLPTGKERIEHLEMVNIVKRFPGVLANDHVNFDVRAGEIHTLLGENGAGKSTLMKQLYGLYRPDEGQIIINGIEHQFRSPQDAINAGIGMIHQHFMLVPELTVLENVALGLKSSRGFMLDLDVVEKRLVQLEEQYGLHVDPQAYVWQLAVGEQQRVEILKALYRGAALLILDEPTAVLTPQEVDEFFVTLRQMAKDGHALIFISHKLHEVLAISHRITVLRDGKVVNQCCPDGVSKTDLAEMMVGRPVILQYDRSPMQRGQAALQIKDLVVGGDRGTDALKGVSLEVHEGEIVGLAGVSGNGQRELAEALAGLRPVKGGQILIGGKDLTHASPAQRILAGQSYIPEERMREGAIKDFSVADNYILEDHGKQPFSRGIFLDFNAIERETRTKVDEYNVKTPTIQTPLKSLSGGNIQKLILARELSRAPKVLIASQPTRGVDIGATEYIHHRLLDQREGKANHENGQAQKRVLSDREFIQQEILDQRHFGTATLLISEDLDEIRALSDRIAVIFAGEIVGIVDGPTSTPEQLGLMMAGVRPDQE